METCPVCRHEFTHKKSLAHHLEIRHEIMRCTLCQQDFKTKNALEQHARVKHHSESSETTRFEYNVTELESVFKDKLVNKLSTALKRAPNGLLFRDITANQEFGHAFRKAKQDGVVVGNKLEFTQYGLPLLIPNSYFDKEQQTLRLRTNDTQKSNATKKKDDIICVQFIRFLDEQGRSFPSTKSALRDSWELFVERRNVPNKVFENVFTELKSCRLLVEDKKGIINWEDLKAFLKKNQHVEEVDFAQRPSSTSLASEPIVIESLEKLQTKLVPVLSACRESESFALCLEGGPEIIYFMQIASKQHTFLLDCQGISAKEVCKILKPFLESTSITKTVHDVHFICHAFLLHGIHIGGVYDTQLAHEVVHPPEIHIGFSELLSRYNLTHKTKQSIRDTSYSDKQFWAIRPLSKTTLAYAAEKVELLLQVGCQIEPSLTELGLKYVMEASAIRVSMVKTLQHARTRAVCFDMEMDYLMRSLELVKAQDPSLSRIAPQGPVIVVDQESDQLINVVPKRFLVGLSAEMWDSLRDIVLDKGRRPQVYLKDGRHFLLEDTNEIVTETDLSEAVEALGGEDRFGNDNRAAMDSCLHRISAIRNRHSNIVGLTMRAGRSVSGNANMILDLLLNSTCNILILGEPGSGKTTIVREIAKVLAERNHVFIIDTSNEIAGDGDVPHPCVGLARRLQVPSLNMQAQVMVECVQNHTPEVMVIDEIGRSPEVEAAKTVKQRGVRIISTGHGTLRKLNKNKQLRASLGALESVILQGGVPKTVRVGEPTFEVVIEVSRGKYDEWVIIPNVAKAVDCILEGQQYDVQHRIRDATTGGMRIMLDKM
eukprot:m.5483 g.5483  ORF g.5483 m.5483 type:complete len:827 (-) comp3316_c0_seq1:2383-4863(-)